MSEQPMKSTDNAPNTFVNGAQWVRVDFHLHTKADKEFKYTDSDDAFIRNYVGALKASNITLGVITNHNKFDLGEFKGLRKAARKENVELLPGVEFSVGDGHNGVHTLIVFSDEWIADGHDYINQFLNIAFAGKPKQQYENENGRSELNIAQTLDQLEKFGRDFFLVFAHVEDKSGLWKELGGGRIGELGNDERFLRRTLGFQKVRSYNKAQDETKPCRTKIQDRLGDWYPAEVEGSDPKAIDQIGKGKECFVKLGTPSFDALKFALCDPDSRVANEAPKHQASHILSARFEGGVLNGQTLHFSPQLNTLIGIRGSGKSSVLEAIRYALDIPHGEKALDTKYKDDLTRHTLGSGGKITLTARDNYGQVFEVSRIFKEPSNVYLDGQLQPGVSIRETVLNQPIYFGQKDLSSTGEGFETDLVEKLVGEKLTPLRTEIEAQRERIQASVARWIKLQNTEEQKREYTAQRNDAIFRLQKYEEHGVSEKLHKKLRFTNDATALKRISDRVDAFVGGLGALLAEHEDNLRNATIYTSQQNPEFFEAYYAEFAKVLATLDELKTIATTTKTISETLKAKIVDFEGLRKTLQDEFAEIERQLAQDLKQGGIVAIHADDFIEQQRRKNKASEMLEALEKDAAQQSSLRDALLKDTEQLNELWLREFRVIQEELERVNANHSALQIEANFKGDKEAAISFMQLLYKGSNIREATLRAVMEPYSDFGGLFKDLDSAKSRAGSTPDIFEKRFMENLTALLTKQVPNQFIIRYQGKELKHHSLGQRASALLLYVLSQGRNDVIIIDQPEDDLDNQTIYDDVIRLIRELKPKVQFIFATHNANFPVLGDAEQVHAFEFKDERIHVQSGSIDAQSIQNAIINIMEGGREAFRRRNEVYTSWKPQS